MVLLGFAVPVKEADSRRDEASFWRAKANVSRFYANQAKDSSSANSGKRVASATQSQGTPVAHSHLVLPGLHLGSQEAEADYSHLVSLGVSKILQVGIELVPSHANLFSYMHIPIYDTEEEDIVDVFAKCFRFIDEGRMQGVSSRTHKDRIHLCMLVAETEARAGGVLVHCMAGVSRSASLVIGYVMWKQRMTFNNARQLVKTARPIINPNLGFKLQLMLFEKEGLDWAHWQPWSFERFLSLKAEITSHGVWDDGTISAVCQVTPAQLYSEEGNESSKAAGGIAASHDTCMQSSEHSMHQVRGTLPAAPSTDARTSQAIAHEHNPLAAPPGIMEHKRLDESMINVSTNSAASSSNSVDEHQQHQHQQHQQHEEHSHAAHCLSVNLHSPSMSAPAAAHSPAPRHAWIACNDSQVAASPLPPLPPMSITLGRRLSGVSIRHSCPESPHLLSTPAAAAAAAAAGLPRRCSGTATLPQPAPFLASYSSPSQHSLIPHPHPVQPSPFSHISLTQQLHGPTSSVQSCTSQPSLTVSTAINLEPAWSEDPIEQPFTTIGTSHPLQHSTAPSQLTSNVRRPATAPQYACEPQGIHDSSANDDWSHYQLSNSVNGSAFTSQSTQSTCAHPAHSQLQQGHNHSGRPPQAWMEDNQGSCSQETSSSKCDNIMDLTAAWDIVLQHRAGAVAPQQQQQQHLPVSGPCQAPPAPGHHVPCSGAAAQDPAAAAAAAAAGPVVQLVRKTSAQLPLSPRTSLNAKPPLKPRFSRLQLLPTGTEPASNCVTDILHGNQPAAETAAAAAGAPQPHPQNSFATAGNLAIEPSSVMLVNQPMGSSIGSMVGSVGRHPRISSSTGAAAPAPPGGPATISCEEPLTPFVALGYNLVAAAAGSPLPSPIHLLPNPPVLANPHPLVPSLAAQEGSGPGRPSVRRTHAIACAVQCCTHLWQQAAAHHSEATPTGSAPSNSGVDWPNRGNPSSQPHSDGRLGGKLHVQLHVQLHAATLVGRAAVAEEPYRAVQSVYTPATAPATPASKPSSSAHKPPTGKQRTAGASNIQTSGDGASSPAVPFKHPSSSKRRSSSSGSSSAVDPKGGSSSSSSCITGAGGSTGGSSSTEPQLALPVAVTPLMLPHIVSSRKMPL